MQCSKMDRQSTDAMMKFREIVSRLRSENGCPWDRTQTLMSLKPCLINEMAEAIAAVNLYEEKKDAENLCEELGDLLFLLVLQIQMAEEKGLFTFEDVLQGISEKMIRRHPNVFPDKDGQTRTVSWEKIKQQERSGKEDAFLTAQRKAVKNAEREITEYLNAEKLRPE